MVSLAADLVVEEPLKLGVEAKVAWASRPRSGEGTSGGRRREDKVNFCTGCLGSFMVIEVVFGVCRFGRALGFSLYLVSVLLV